MAYETTDVLNKEQVTMGILTGKLNLQVCEASLGLYHASSIDASTLKLSTVINDLLRKMNLNLVGSAMIEQVLC